MMRYRWYRLRLPSSLKKTIQALAEKEFISEADTGFSLINHASSSGRFRFWWKTNVAITRFDEYGEPSFENIASVNHTDFELFRAERYFVLRVENPGRSCRELLNAIETVLGYGFYCKAITFEGLQYQSLFERFGPANLIGLKVVGALPNRGLLARVDLVSKEGMREREISLLREMTYKTEQATFEILFHGTRGQIAISSSGLVRATGHLAPMLIDLIQRALPELLESAEEES